MKPTVSVVITTYNQAAYISDTIQSVLQQTIRPKEIIVIDDGSTDDTPNRIASFGNQIVYVRQRNQGVASARNTGVSAASGDCIALLDGDDLWDEEKLAHQIHALERYPDSGLVVTDVCHFTDAGVLWTDFVKRHLFGGEDVPLRSGNYFDQLLKRNWICTTSQVLIPAACLRDVGASDPRFPVASDYDLYLRIAAKYPITFVNRVLTRWRFLETSASGPRGVRGFRWAEDCVLVLRKHAKSAPAELKPSAHAAWRGALSAAVHGAYSRGCESDRLWASRYLMRLAFSNPEAPWVGLFVAALWAPGVVRHTVGPVIRKAADLS